MGFSFPPCWSDPILSTTSEPIVARSFRGCRGPGDFGLEVQLELVPHSSGRRGALALPGAEGSATRNAE